MRVGRFSLRDVAEVIGVSGIIASLIFVGLQLKQSQEIALSNAYQARTEASLTLRGLPLESPTLLSAITKLNSTSGEELSQDERTALNFFFASSLIYLENSHYQYTNGFLTEEQWQSNVGDLRNLFERQYFRQTWEGGFGAWRSSFVTEIEKVLRQTDAREQDPD